jgi:hypothetical protein
VFAQENGMQIGQSDMKIPEEVIKPKVRIQHGEEKK